MSVNINKEMQKHEIPLQHPSPQFAQSSFDVPKVKYPVIDFIDVKIKYQHFEINKTTEAFHNLEKLLEHRKSKQLEESELKKMFVYMAQVFASQKITMLQLKNVLLTPNVGLKAIHDFLSEDKENRKLESLRLINCNVYEDPPELIGLAQNIVHDTKIVPEIKLKDSVEIGASLLGVLACATGLAFSERPIPLFIAGTGFIGTLYTFFNMVKNHYKVINQ